MTGVRNRIGLVVVLLLVLIPAVYVLADEAYIDSDRFTVNTAEIDGDIQFTDVTGCSVRMQVTNHGDDFEGTLKILRYECTDGSYVSAVGRTVHIKSGETQDIYLKLSNIAYDGTPYHVPLRVDFLDKDGQLLCQKITDFQVSPDITTKVAAGVYADDAQKLAVIDQSRFKYETTNISGDITMKSRQMTDEELANIKQLNINLLILDKVVSESTWENVSEWIMCGGYAMMEKACCQNMIHKMPDDNGLVDWGKGRILVYDASEWNGIMFLKSVRNLFGTDGIHALIAGDYSGYYWNVQTILNYDIASKLPPVTIYFVILLIYILCIGPAVYMILKKRDKREYMWLWIPCLAILFSVIVYKAGSSVCYAEPFIRYYSVVDITEEANIEQTKLVLISPNKGRSVFSIDSQYNLKLLNDMYLLYDDQNDRLTALKEKFGDAEYNVAMSVSDTRTDVMVNSAATFDEEHFSNERILNSEGGIDVDAAYYRGELTGTVTNTTPWNLHDAFIIHKGLLFQLGDLDAGQTIILDHLKEAQLVKSRNDVLDTWEMKNEGNTAAVSAVMSDLIGNITSASSMTLADDIVGGFSMDYDIGVQISEDIASVDGITLIKEKTAIADSGSGWATQALIGPEEPESEEELYAYDTDSYMIYGTDMLNVSYVVERLSGELYLKWLNPDAGMSVSFYNLSTGVYDTVFRDSDEMAEDDLKNYIAKDGKIKAHVQAADANEDHYMPVFTVSGGEEND